MTFSKSTLHHSLVLMVVCFVACQCCYFSNCPLSHKWRGKKDGREGELIANSDVLTDNLDPISRADELNGLQRLQKVIEDNLNLQCYDSISASETCLTPRIVAAICCVKDPVTKTSQCEINSSVDENYVEDRTNENWLYIQQVLKGFVDMSDSNEKDHYCISLRDCCMNGNCQVDIVCSMKLNHPTSGNKYEPNGPTMSLQKLIDLIRRRDNKKQ